MAMTASEVRHLLRRTGFGVLPEAVQDILDQGLDRAAAVDQLLDFTPSRFRPGGRYFYKIHDKWVKYLVKTRNQLQEKLVLFWHDHFATNYSKVGDVRLMSLQNRLFRINCRGNFKTLMKAVNIDPAMMEMLDTVRNRDNAQNENYARELMELFTLGVFDSSGNPNYDQADIVEIARAFTGWDYDDDEAFMRDSRHDFGTPKEIFATRGNFSGAQDITANGTGEGEIDEVIEILLRHRDSDLQNTTARFITRKLIEYFAHPNPSQAYVDDCISASSFATAWELTPLLKQIFIHDDFYLSAAGPPYTAASVKSVKWPIDLVVGTMRTLRMKFKGKYTQVQGGSYNTAENILTNMGQTLFEPPSVFGWAWEQSWLSSATLLARYGYVRDLVTSRENGRSSFRPGELIDLSLTDPGDIVDAVLDALGIPDQLTITPGGERDILINYLTDGGTVSQLDLNDLDVQRTKLAGLFALVMQTAAFQLH
jgi:uncharacterized protein (DUF1800 family)